ncbi:MAG: M48 family metallopeptidase [Flavobacteriales bacterium]
MKKIITGLCSIVLFLGCATNPITGRKQLSMVSETNLFPQSFAAYQQTLKKSKLSTNAQHNAQVQRVGKRIQVAVEKFFNDIGKPHALANYKWEYKVIESDQLNAWCMPGGKVAFYTGILPVCKDDAGIAVVMGHEIAHAIANHGGERMSQGKLINIGSSAVAIGAGGASASTQQAIMQAYGIGSQVGMLSYSRKHEAEADEMGILFMALAGYDPTVAPAFWERMEAMSNTNGQQAPPEFMSTHPHPKTRIAELNAIMPIAKQVYQTKSIEPYFLAKKRKR